MYEEEFLRRASAGTIIPPRQNLQILGERDFDNLQFGYHLYLGNGSNTDANSLDINRNKSLGTRFWLKPYIENLTIGASFYTEKGDFTIRPHLDTKAIMEEAQSSGVQPSDIVPILPTVTESETRRTFGLEARYLKGNFEIRGEFVRSRSFDLALVDASTISDTVQTYTFNTSAFSKTFYYINLNYILWEKLTPFFELNMFDDPRHFVFRNKLHRLTWGTAFRPNSNVTLKMEFHQHLFGDEFNKKPNDFKNFQMLWFAASIFFN